MPITGRAKAKRDYRRKVLKKKAKRRIKGIKNRSEKIVMKKNNQTRMKKRRIKCTKKLNFTTKSKAKVDIITR